jgi:hypothetical protein
MSLDRTVTPDDTPSAETHASSDALTIDTDI